MANPTKSSHQEANDQVAAHGNVWVDVEDHNECREAKGSQNKSNSAGKQTDAEADDGLCGNSGSGPAGKSFDLVAGWRTCPTHASLNSAGPQPKLDSLPYNQDACRKNQNLLGDLATRKAPYEGTDHGWNSLNGYDVEIYPPLSEMPVGAGSCA
jgi:hypothetical protein